MIGKIGPLVQGETSRKSWTLLHVLGGCLGGAAAGLILASISALFSQAAPVAAAAAPTVLLPVGLLYAGFVDAGIVRMPIFNPSRQTPGWWPCAFGDKAAIFMWGADLGLGFSTRITFQGLLPLALFGLLAGNVVTAVLVMSLYGFVRALTVVTVILRCRRSLPEACSTISRSKHKIHLAVATATVALGTMLFGMSSM